MSESIAISRLPSLPQGWEYKELGDLLEPDGLSYGIVQPGSEESGGVPILRVKNLRDGRVVRDDVKHVSKEIDELHRRTRLLGGEILLSLVGSVGEVAVAQPDVARWNVARAIGVLRPNHHVSSQWIKLCLGTEVVKHLIRSWRNETVQATLNLRDVRRLPILMPPSRIREAITCTVAALDDKIAVNERIVSATTSLADARLVILKHAEGSSTALTFGEIADVYGGGTPSTKEPAFWDGGISWATPTDITRLTSPYLTSTAQTLTEVGLSSCASALHPPGSIFMTSRATIGRIAINEVPAATNQGFIVVRPRQPFHRWWFFHEMRGRVGEMVSISNGSTFLELSRRNFKEMPLLKPSDEALINFHNLVDPLHGRASAANRESHALAELRDTLLPKLMSGELRIKDAERAVSDAV